PDLQVVFKDCEKVEVRDDMPSRVENLDPATYDGTTPIPVDQFLEAFLWKDKEVTVVGSFNGSTTSTTKSGTYIRIDLYDAGDENQNQLISAYFDEEIPQENFGTSKVWKIKCTASGEGAFDRPELQHCHFVEQVQ